MTKENAKKLYDHYVSIGYDKAAKDMVKKYPDFAAKPKAKEEEEKPKKEEKGIIDKPKDGAKK